MKASTGTWQVFSGLVAALAAAAAFNAGAAEYPNKAISLIAPFTAGSGIDTQARILAAALSERLKVPVVVENRAGAAGLIGSRAVAHAQPDGHTLLMGAKYLAVESALRPDYALDPAKDLAPVSLLVESPFVLVVAQDGRSETAAQTLSRLKARGTTVSFATPGAGTQPHVYAELLRLRTGLPLIAVHYKGEVQELADLLGGHVDLAFLSTMISGPNLRSGKLRALGVTWHRREDSLPDVPTLAEAGVKGLEFLYWGGVFAPAGTPAPIIRRLSKEIAGIVQSASFAAAMKSSGITPFPGGPEDLALRLRNDRDAIRKLASETGLKLEP